MSSSFDIVQIALSWLKEQVDPDNQQARQVLHYIEATVDKWHDVHHSGVEQLNRVAYAETQLLLTVLRYDDPQERQLWLDIKRNQ